MCLQYSALAKVNAATQSIKIDELEIQILEQEFIIQRFKQNSKTNNKLIIWVAPGFGTDQRAKDMSKRMAEQGTEIWHVDLAENLFLTKSTNTMRKLDGKYLKTLIEQAYKKTNKNIVLLTRSYGAIPVLRALRLWQIDQAAKQQPFYLQGAILFSPELYATVPELGLEPVFVNIIDATNMPLMIYQGEKRSNRWQIEKLLNRFSEAGANAYYNLLKGVNGVFYSGDKKAETLKQIELMPKKIFKAFRLLEKTTKPMQAASLINKINIKPMSLNINLKIFKGNNKPRSIDLMDVNNKRYKNKNYLGKVTVVNFWATWCPPCVEEIPSLNNLKRLMKDENFELVSINYGEKKETIQRFMNKVNVDFPVLLDPNGVQSAKWKVLVFPSTFVIGPNGKIIYGVNAAIHWDAPGVVRALKTLLKQAVDE